MERTQAQTNRVFHSRDCSRRGLTLAELILAMAITAMACVAIAATMNATANTWEANQQDDQTLVSSANTLRRLRTIVGDAKLFGPRSANELVLWAGDSNGNFQIEYSECVMIRYDGPTNQLQLLDIYFPPGTPQSYMDARNVVLIYTDFSDSQLATLLKADAYARSRTLADDVVSFSFSIVGQDPYFRTAMFSFRLGQDDPSQQFDAVVSMRSPAYYLVE